MDRHVPPHRVALPWLIAAIAAALASCTASKQKMDMAPDLISTPPHRMARAEYPFDASGRYVDAWAAEGATRYGRFINTDRTDDGRTATPVRRPVPPPRPTATKKPTTTKPTASKPSTSKPTAAKPPAKKPAAKKPTTHTVKKGDSLSSIGRRYGVSVQALKRANNLKSDRIVTGRNLVIPR